MTPLSPLREVYFCQNQGGYEFCKRSLLAVNEYFKTCIQRQVWQKDAFRSGLTFTFCIMLLIRREQSYTLFTTSLFITLIIHYLITEVSDFLNR